MKLLFFWCSVKRIFGGENAVPHAFPNVVAIHGPGTEESAPGMFCSGIIYNPMWIATAAMCVASIDILFPKETIKVLAGKQSLRETEMFQQLRHITKAIEHDDYDPSHFGTSTDLGLMKLERALIYTHFVKALPISRNVSYPSGFGEILGWGCTTIDEEERSRPADHLQHMDVEIVPYAACEFAVKKTMMVQGDQVLNDPINQFHFCTGTYTSVQQGPSLGDSGGPFLQKNESGVYNVIGLISAGVDSPNLGVYIHLTPFIEWIDEIIEQYTEPTDSYETDIQFNIFLNDTDYDD